MGSLSSICRCGHGTYVTVNLNDPNSKNPRGTIASCARCKHTKELLLEVSKVFYEDPGCYIIINALINSSGWKMSLNELEENTHLDIRSLRASCRFLKEDGIISERMNDEDHLDNPIYQVRLECYRSIVAKILGIGEKLLNAESTHSILDIGFQCKDPACSNKRIYKIEEMRYWIKLKESPDQYNIPGDKESGKRTEYVFPCEACEKEMEEVDDVTKESKFARFLEQTQKIDEDIALIKKNLQPKCFRTYKTLDVVTEDGIPTGQRRRMLITDETTTSVTISIDKPTPAAVLHERIQMKRMILNMMNEHET